MSSEREPKQEQITGLSTKNALKQLHQDIENLLLDFENRHKNSWIKPWCRDTLHQTSQYTTLCWTSAAVLFTNAIALVIAYVCHEDPRFGYLGLEAAVITLLTVINFYFVAWDSKLRHEEIPVRVRDLLAKIQDALDKSEWHPGNYPHLCSPFSPCITLQWTYRDGNIVNLPWALLVNGDLVVIRPGQAAPGHCSPMQPNSSLPDLQPGDVFNPASNKHQETFANPTARKPLKNHTYVMKETPYLSNLRLAFEEALNRPVTYHNQQRYTVMVQCLEHIAVPVALVCVILINIFRYTYFSNYVTAGHWTEMFLLQPVAVTLPLLPLLFPTAWLALNYLGMARIRTLLDVSPETSSKSTDPFEDAEAEPKQDAIRLSSKLVRHHFVKILRGDEPSLCRSANILHVLGTVTALCCVDKKGILSWPNPTAEKVFFLRNSMQGSPEPSLMSEDAALYSEGMPIGTSTGDQVDDEDERNVPTAGQTVAEVLDLTHDHASPFQLHFDDHKWKQYMSSLKPLGLSILLNTCNMATQEHYTSFCSHVTCEALYNEDLVPVTNRRKTLTAPADRAAFPAVNKCLCELAKQIGFLDSAKDIFELEDQLSTFRHVQPELVRRDIKFARSLSINTKLKFPFPHMVAVVVKEKYSRSLQLLAQGTADIVLDSCVEFWNGRDLCPLSPADRKKVQDFYQRTSLTAYCTAFAYRPLSRSFNHEFSNVYLELPQDSRHLYMPYRSPTPLALECHAKGILGSFQSTDSLFGSEIKESAVNTVDECFEMQCNQIFVGMVTMQYQAQIDMVKLIDQLERACIRFVHFSKENELRSRVFSEKMGLESGWNCHISLLSERNRSGSEASESRANANILPRWRLGSSSPLSGRTRTSSDKLNTDPNEAVRLIGSRNLRTSRVLSLSAPSAINMEYAQVKFEDEGHQEAADSWPEDRLHREGEDEGMASQDSILLQSMDFHHHDGCRSLSCLTDSTEQSAPVNFDMSNRAKLPRGIDKIRPHLENIDNVPLLVSLFTDCTPSATREMLQIMQDYGEVVCVMGSAANADNMGIFLQADASIAVEPLYPQVCQKVAVFVPTEKDKGLSPVDLSRVLNSVACSIGFRREEPVSIYHLIMEARHFMQGVWNCVQFWVCSAACVSALQLVGILLMLPPIFTTGQVLWLVLVVIPPLSLSLVGSPTDVQVMQRPTGKKQCAVISPKKVAIFVLWCYGAKFVPTVFVVQLFFAVTLDGFCKEIAQEGYNTTCSLVYPLANLDAAAGENTVPHSWGGWHKHRYSLLTVQHAASILLVLHFVCISVSFVHREYLCWVKWPHRNRLWLYTSVVVCLLQALYSTAFLATVQLDETEESVDAKVLYIPWLLLFLALLSPFLILIINEFIKWQEIKANVRYQKRARLEFGTKLGMNSPF